MELDHEYEQLAQIKNLTDEVLHLKETLSTCQCTEQLLAARFAMPPGDTRPGCAAHANPYAVDVGTGAWSIFRSKEITGEELRHKLKTIKAGYERSKAEIAILRQWLHENEYSVVYAIFEEIEIKDSILLPVYVAEIQRLEWFTKHSKEEIVKNSNLKVELKQLDDNLKHTKNYASVELTNLEQKLLLLEAHTNPSRQGMHTYFGNRYGTNKLTEANMLKTPPKHGGMHNFFWDRWGTKYQGVSVSR
jgi:hypothetical protein